MLKRKVLFPLLITLFLILDQGCTPKAKLVYMQGDNALLNDTTSFTMTLSPGDIIMVQLFTINQEAFPGFGLSQVSSEGNDNRTPYEKGFVMDASGKVVLPYIGEVNLNGFTIGQAHDTVTQRFRKFIDDPVVILKKLSFKIAVMGEVSRPGLYYVPNEKLTLMEALSMAGDLNNFGDRTKIKILRKTPTGVVELPVDITNKTAYSGITKYIYPDDVIYVPPTRKKAFVEIAPATMVITSFLTTLALFATVYLRTQ